MYKGKLRVGDKVKGTNMPSKYKVVSSVSNSNTLAQVESREGYLWTIRRERNGYWGSDGGTGYLTLVKPIKKTKPAKAKVEKKVIDPKVGFITVSGGEDLLPWSAFVTNKSVDTFPTKEELVKWINERSTVKGIKVYQIFSELEVKGNFELVLK